MGYVHICSILCLFEGNIFPEKFGAENNFSVNVTLQDIPIGGIHSAYATEDNPNIMAHSWRKDFQYVYVLDMFYDPHDEAAKEFAEKWAHTNDAESMKWSGFDRRFLWSTFGKTTDPDQGMVLDTVWDKYFDSRWDILLSVQKNDIEFREKYDKLIAIKRRFDPCYVFTPNALGVDATSAPLNQRPVIIEK